MSRFAPALRSVAADLDLPRRVRAAILLEMAADLESAYEHHRRRGLGEEEAARRAEEIVLGSPEVLRRLGRLHARSWRRWSEEVGSRLSGGADLLLLAVAVVPILVLAGAATVPLLLASPANPVVWALLGIAGGIAVLGVSKGAGLGRGASGPALRRGLPHLLLLSAVAPALGLLGLTLGVQDVALTWGAAGTEASAPVEAAAKIGRDAALLAVGLLLGIAGSLTWFTLMNRAALRDVRDVDALLEGGARGLSHGERSSVVPLVRSRGQGRETRLPIESGHTKGGER